MSDGDPLGLTREQRAVSDFTAASGRMLTDMVMACPLCWAYECLPGCLTVLARTIDAIRPSGR